MTAEERGSEMMKVPMNTLPPLALAFCKQRCSELGGCGEVFLTSWIVYAQEIEGLRCKNKLYKSSKADKKWFTDNKKVFWRYEDINGKKTLVCY